MKLPSSVISALELLYGEKTGSGADVCAVSPKFRLLWRSSPRAEQYFFALQAQLPLRPGDAPALAPDGTVILSGVQPPVLCRSEALMQGEQACYLIHFSPLTDRRGNDLPEIRALIQQQIDVCGRAAYTLLDAAEALSSRLRAADKSVLREIERAGYAMLHRKRQDEELLWYEAAPRDCALIAPTVNAADLFSQFVMQLHRLTDTVLALDGAEIADSLPVRVEPKRLEFALLTLWIQTQQGNPAASSARFSARQQDGFAALTMTVSAGKTLPEGTCRRPDESDTSLAGRLALLERFCTAYGAQQTVSETADSTACTLLLPLAGTAPDLVTFRAPVEDLTADRTGTYYAMLTEIYSADALL